MRAWVDSGNEGESGEDDAESGKGVECQRKPVKRMRTLDKRGSCQIWNMFPLISTDHCSSDSCEYNRSGSSPGALLMACSSLKEYAFRCRTVLTL